MSISWDSAIPFRTEDSADDLVVWLFSCLVVLLIAFLHCEDKQQNNQTTKQQNNQTTKQQNNQTTKQQDPDIGGFYVLRQDCMTLRPKREIACLKRTGVLKRVDRKREWIVG